MRGRGRGRRRSPPGSEPKGLGARVFPAAVAASRSRTDRARGGGNLGVRASEDGSLPAESRFSYPFGCGEKASLTGLGVGGR